ncbi:DNA-directed RNA polymerase subunit K [Candidatus Woesearchaeota archaeon]|nr:DNA-directed RNA polymerase subunit K [Candidatus Woesearchaeota archaeon]
MGYTKFEKARIVGSRALQISMGAPILLKISEKDLEEMKYNPIKIAMKEFEEGVIPITIKRNFPGGRHELKEHKANEKK